MKGRSVCGWARWGAALWLAAWLSIQGAGAAVTLALTPGGAEPSADARETMAVNHALPQWPSGLKQTRDPKTNSIFISRGWTRIASAPGMEVELQVRQVEVHASEVLTAYFTNTLCASAAFMNSARGVRLVVGTGTGECVESHALASAASGTVNQIVVDYSIRVRVTGTLRKGRYRFDYPLTVGGAGTPTIRATCSVAGVSQNCPAAITNIPITVDVAHSITVPTLGGAVTLAPTGSGSGAWSSAGQSLAAVTSTSGFYRLSIRSCTHHERGTNRCGLQHATAGGEVFPVRVQAGSVEVDRGSPQQLASGAGGALRFEMDAATGRRMQQRAGSYRGDITLLFEADIEP